MPVFNDQTEIMPVVPEGDYIFTVTSFDCGVSTGSKTAGSDNYKMAVDLHDPTTKKSGRSNEVLTDHPSCSWKIDCFVKSAGVQVKKGEAFEFRADIAKQKGVKFVNPEGLRGWCHVIVEEYEKRDKTKGQSNKISIFYTDRPKLEPIEIAPAADAIDPEAGF